MGVVLLLAPIWLCGSQPLEAELCTLDVVPAATVMLPYFEVDLAPSPTVDTIFTLHNALPEPALAHVTVWTDWSVPSLDFDLFLTGYDQVTVSMHDIFVQGWLPITADEQNDQGQDGGRIGAPLSSCTDSPDSCSPHGSNPEWDGSFTGDLGGLDCSSFFPYYVNPLLSGSFLANVRAMHTGQEPQNGLCAGRDLGDGLARGYVTADSVNGCSLNFPSDPEYFTNGTNPGTANYKNTFWGEWYIEYPQEGRAFGDALVHLEADADFRPEDSATGYTFYGRFTQGHGTFDGREPLSSVWAARYFNGEESGTEWIVWRDPTSSEVPQGYACGSQPPWAPMQEAEVRCFDMQEQSVQLCVPGEEDPACFPVNTQRIGVGTGDLSLPYPVGWCSLDFSAPDSFTGDVDFAGDTQQAFVLAISGFDSADSSAAPATPLSSACMAPNPR